MGNPVINRSTRFAEMLNRLRTRGGVAAEAAKEVSRIIGNITTMPADRPADIGRMTRHGETRIKHCFKYDLGGGYRLVTVRAKDTVFLLFVGSHDDEERWLDANRGLEPVIDEKGKITLIEGKDFSQPLPQPPEAVFPDRTLFSYLSPDERAFLNAPPACEFLTHFSSEDELISACDGAPPATGNVLLDVLVLLRDLKPESAHARLALAMRCAQPLTTYAGDIDEAIRADVNRDSLLNLRDLSEEEYKLLLQGSLAEWMLYLHPDQRSVAFGDFDGPVRLQGVAGSGKTSVLLHRAKHLAERFLEGRVAVLTLNPSLAALLSDLLDDLAPAAARKRIDILDADSFMRLIIDKFHPHKDRLTLAPATEVQQEDAFWEVLKEGHTGDGLDDLRGYLTRRGVDVSRYLRDEFVWVQSAFTRLSEAPVTMGLPSRNTYLDANAAPREGRSVPFTREHRAAVVGALRAYEKKLYDQDTVDRATVALLAYEAIANIAARPPLFRAILVDEVQDLSTVELAVVAAAVGSQPNGLFLTGDPAQQVFPKEHSIRKAGIKLSARRYFRKNYRNPRQILEAGLSVLAAYGGPEAPGGADNDETPALAPELAARNSANPLLVRCSTADQELIYVASVVRRRLREVAYPVCIVLTQVHEGDETALDDYLARFEAAGLSVTLLRKAKKLVASTAYLSALETVKGFEFSTVFLMGMGTEFPSKQLPEEERWRDVRRFYVALTRARDEALLTYAGNKSEIFSGMDAFFGESDAEEQFIGESTPPTTVVPAVPSTAALAVEVETPSEVAVVVPPSDMIPAPAEPVEVAEFLSTVGLTVVDKRERGGCLWVVGDRSLDPIMRFLSTNHKLYFTFTANGSRSTRHLPGWYLKEPGSHFVTLGTRMSPPAPTFAPVVPVRQTPTALPVGAVVNVATRAPAVQLTDHQRFLRWAGEKGIQSLRKDPSIARQLGYTGDLAQIITKVQKALDDDDYDTLEVFNEWFTKPPGQDASLGRP